MNKLINFLKNFVLAANNSIAVTDQLLRTLSSELFSLDQNNVRGIITVAAQGRATGCPGVASDRFSVSFFKKKKVVQTFPINF